MNTDFELKVTPFKTTDKIAFEQARKIRELVFVIEQKVDEREEFDDFEEESTHYLLMTNNQAVGTARWRFIGDKIKLERFAVLKEFRGKQMGDVLLQKVIADVLTFQKPVYLHAQLKAIPFYSRRGFEKVGELFLECDIEHFKMELKV